MKAYLRVALPARVLTVCALFMLGARTGKAEDAPAAAASEAGSATVAGVADSKMLQVEFLGSDRAPVRIPFADGSASDGVELTDVRYRDVEPATSYPDAFVVDGVKWTSKRHSDGACAVSISYYRKLGVAVIDHHAWPVVDGQTFTGVISPAGGWSMRAGRLRISVVTVPLSGTTAAPAK